LLAHYVLNTKEDRSSEFYGFERMQLDEALSRLRELEKEIKKFNRTTSYRPHTIYTLLDPARVHAIRKDLEQRLQTIFRSSTMSNLQPGFPGSDQDQ
jgi:hypothetical protein